MAQAINQTILRRVGRSNWWRYTLRTVFVSYVGADGFMIGKWKGCTVTKDRYATAWRVLPDRVH